jgi:hypothetical protein
LNGNYVRVESIVGRVKWSNFKLCFLEHLGSETPMHTEVKLFSIQNYFVYNWFFVKFTTLNAIFDESIEFKTPGVIEKT